MRLDDVRRLTGASLNLDRPGAVGELIELPEGRAGPVLALWRRAARGLLDRLGWEREITAVRPYPGGGSVAVSAPVDGLYTAAYLVESAWAIASARLAGRAVDTGALVEDLTARAAREAEPRLVRLAEAARARRVTFLLGEGKVSLGLGVNGEQWPDEAPPDPADVDWDALGGIPVAMVTGTNGKSTTVRLAAAIAAAAGRTAGQCSSDWVKVGAAIVDTGDYSGPSGARQAARHPETELAVLETARGGLMRRGLAIPEADICLITNVAADHLGDYGIVDVPTLAAAKFFVATALKPGGRLILNADDAEVARRGAAHDGDIAWFSLTPEESGIDAWIAAGGTAAVLRDGALLLARGGGTEEVIAAEDFPLSMKGAARFNIANALGAILIADGLGLPVAAMRAGLAGFSGSPEENPGRGNFMDLGGVTAVVDFAHNPHGVAAFLGALANVPAKRRAVLVGQAGDRSDDDTRELARATWSGRPDLVVIKDLLKKLRGRAPGELPAVLEAEFRRLGADEGMLRHASSEVEATRRALEWAEPGDLLVLLIHEDRAGVTALLDRLGAEGWQPGRPLPEGPV